VRKFLGLFREYHRQKEEIDGGLTVLKDRKYITTECLYTSHIDAYPHHNPLCMQIDSTEKHLIMCGIIRKFSFSLSFIIYLLTNAFIHNIQKPHARPTIPLFT
jgi:hypothetical protein